MTSCLFFKTFHFCPILFSNLSAVETFSAKLGFKCFGRPQEINLVDLKREEETLEAILVEKVALPKVEIYG